MTDEDVFGHLSHGDNHRRLVHRWFCHGWTICWYPGDRQRRRIRVAVGSAARRLGGQRFGWRRRKDSDEA
ncbi:MAG: hypothetical protein ACJA14_000811 [Ilumatobacter sp.]|jgi:hypothetical protein